MKNSVSNGLHGKLTCICKLIVPVIMFFLVHSALMAQKATLTWDEVHTLPKEIKDIETWFIVEDNNDFILYKKDLYGKLTFIRIDRTLNIKSVSSSKLPGYIINSSIDNGFFRFIVFDGSITVYSYDKATLQPTSMKTLISRNDLKEKKLDGLVPAQFAVRTSLNGKYLGIVINSSRYFFYLFDNGLNLLSEGMSKDYLPEIAGPWSKPWAVDITDDGEIIVPYILNYRENHRKIEGKGAFGAPISSGDNKSVLSVFTYSKQKGVESHDLGNISGDSINIYNIWIIPGRENELRLSGGYSMFMQGTYYLTQGISIISCDLSKDAVTSIKNIKIEGAGLTQNEKGKLDWGGKVQGLAVNVTNDSDYLYGFFQNDNSDNIYVTHNLTDVKRFTYRHGKEKIWESWLNGKSLICIVVAEDGRIVERDVNYEDGSYKDFILDSNPLSTESPIILLYKDKDGKKDFILLQKAKKDKKEVVARFGHLTLEYDN